MSTDSGVNVNVKRRRSDLIRYSPSRNLHLGIRLAEKLGLGLNLFVTFNFTMTACDPAYADRAFAKLREAFGKWATRPNKSRLAEAFSPTFVWVIENPDECLNAHWLVHVPRKRQADFKANLSKWLENAVGDIYDERAIKVKVASNVEGLKAYLLKGLHPSLAKLFGIRYINQGWVYGRRIGHSKNIGPVQVKKWRDLGVFPAAKRWITYSQ
jgi:hypothetical protein